MAAKKSKSQSKAATKKVASGKVAKKPSATKATIKKSPAKKTVSNRASSKKTVAKKTTAKKAIAKSRSKPSSVDGILKQFQKERVAQETKLVSVRSEIKDLTGKIQAYEKQIVKLKAQQLDTENSICTLDTRRDQEVANLLSSLGINLDSIASAADAAGKKKVDKPTPLFDAQPDDGQSENADMSQEELEERATRKPKVDILIAGQE